MKFALIGDCHIDDGNGSKIYQKNFENFCSLVLFPELKSRNIKLVLQTGDLFDVRKKVDTDSLNSAKECFFSKMKSNKIDLHIILGNHDLHFKESLKVNTPELVLAEYDNITIHKKPETLVLDNIKIDMLSWICEENEKETLNYIANSKSEYCFAHLELVGFKMSKSFVAEHGMDANIFKKYKQVWSGHYHSQSKDKNIHYIGNPTQDSFEAVDEVKGFHIFDTETLEMEFIPNPYNLFERIVYDDSKKIKVVDVSEKYVKVIVNHCTDDKKFESYIESLWLQSPHDIKVIDNIIADESVSMNVTIEDLDSGGFQIVPFLTEYTLLANVDLNNKQQDLVNETYKKLYKMNQEVNL